MTIERLQYPAQKIEVPQVHVRPGFSKMLVRDGLELSQDMTDHIIESGDVATDSSVIIGLYDNRPGLNFLRHYILYRDELSFKEYDATLKMREWTQYKQLSGVIFAMMPYRTKRVSPVYIENEPNPVVCASVDMFQGIGNPGTVCARCQFSKWPEKEERDRTGKTGPDCPDRWRIFMISDDEIYPYYIDLPGSFRTSIHSFQEDLLKKGGVRPWEVISTLNVYETKDNKLRLNYEWDGLVDCTSQQYVDSIIAFQRLARDLVAQMGDLAHDPA